ncbi:MAG TPA: hypothetical protein PL124_08990 [Candidatus Cloacimonadota bacterium]|nr:hypothetical protein [Candidatus Cloacimonadota bacterium]HPS39532.1 hypothetical protein [Candidatus Cloacimonadota bacterium]
MDKLINVMMKNHGIDREEAEVSVLNALSDLRNQIENGEYDESLCEELGIPIRFMSDLMEMI